MNPKYGVIMSIVGIILLIIVCSPFVGAEAMLSAALSLF